MAALTDLSDLINRLTGGNSGTPETQFWHKLNRVGGVAATVPFAGRPMSAWTYDGQPAGGAVPTVGEIPTRTTIGAMPFAAPGGGREKFLISVGVAPLVAGVYLLYDRLFHIGDLNATLTTDQTVQGSTPSPALTRNTGGEGNIAWAEIYSIVGTSSQTLTMTYTNQAGTGGRTTTTNIGSTGFREVTRVLRLPLMSGDTGIRAVEKVSLSATTGTAGNFGITIARPIAWIPVGSAGAGGWRDYTTGLPGIPAIDPDACLAIASIPAAGTASEMWWAATFIEK
jgi:hypothetical protein